MLQIGFFCDKSSPPTWQRKSHFFQMKWEYFFFLLGSPLSTTSTPSDFIDRFSLPPYNPNNSPKSAEELLKSLVNPIDFDLSEDHYLHPENYPKSGPFFDLHRTKNVTALKGVTTNLICRVRRLGNHTVISLSTFFQFCYFVVFCPKTRQNHKNL